MSLLEAIASRRQERGGSMEGEVGITSRDSASACGLRRLPLQDRLRVCVTARAAGQPRPASDNFLDHLPCRGGRGESRDSSSAASVGRGPPYGRRRRQRHFILIPIARPPVHLHPHPPPISFNMPNSSNPFHQAGVQKSGVCHTTK